MNKNKKVSNGNYLWISYFWSYLNEKGRAGFVMSSQASSAGHGEKDVRKKMIETGDVDVIISIRSNFFYSRAVPCELWFFDRGKPKARRDKVLMLDARNIYRKVTRKINDFSPEQMQNLSAIVWLYREQSNRFLQLAKKYLGSVFTGNGSSASAFPAASTPALSMACRRDGTERLFRNALVLQRGFDLPIQMRDQGEVPVYGSTGVNGFHNKANVRGPGVVTGRSGTLGEVHYVARDFWPLNTALWVKEFKRVTPLFAFFLLREMDLKQYNGGVSVPSLDRKAVHRVEIILPPKKLIEIFNEFASPMFVQIENLRAQNQKLRAACDLLLPRLMSGEIAV